MLKRNNLWALLGATAMVTIMAQPAAAQSIEDLKAQLAALAKRIEELEARQAETEKVTAVKVSEKDEVKRPRITKEEPAFALATDDGLFEMNMRGRIFADATWVSDGDNTTDQKATELRSGRIGIEGKAWKDIKYVIEVDFAGEQVTLADVLFDYKTSVGTWRFGYFKPTLSLEEITSARNITFMERSAFTDAFSFGRNMGVGYINGGSNWTLNLGAFRGNGKDNLEDEGYIFAGRATYGEEFDGGKWILGASARYRDGGDASFRYRQRAHSHIADRFVDTGTITNRDVTYVVEGGLQYGSFHLTSEYSELHAKDAAADGGSAKLWGGFVEAGWFITGEEKTLKLDKGVWDRPKVNNPVHKGGMGAWQVAARFDRLDMTGDGIYGGEQDTYLVGLNWYLNRHARVMANYAHMTFDKAFNVAANGPDGENDADALTLRFQVDW